MKVSENNYKKIEKNVLQFFTENPDVIPTELTVYEIHYNFCLAMREPQHPKIKQLKERYSFNPDTDYFNDFYLNDYSLNDFHMNTVFKKVMQNVP